jgi:acetyl-CoA synthetase/medium-chain acyl-CoA synthetase
MATGIDNPTQGYEELRSSLRLEVPERFNFVRDTFEPWAATDRLGILQFDDAGNEQRVSYHELSERVNQVANVLRAHGVTSGDRVFIMVGRIPEWWETMLACLKVGAVAMPATVQLTPKDIAYRMELSEPVAVVTEGSLAAKFDEVRDKSTTVRTYLSIGPLAATSPSHRLSGAHGSTAPLWLDYRAERDGADKDAVAENTRADDPSILFFTSGTTGFAKMVLHTQASYGIGHTITARCWLELRPDDVHWNISDTGWAKAAWSSLFGPLIAGSAIVIHNPSGAFDAKRTLEILANYPITSVCGPPTVFRSLVLEDLKQYQFPTLRSCVAAGEPLNPEVIATWREATGLEIRDGYGQTESVCLVGNFPGLPVKPGSMGRPSPGFDIAIVGDDGEPLTAGKEGDIGVRIRPQRPVGLFKEYWKNPDANAACVRGDWYITGDRAIRDEDGYLWFVGRADDVIISAGYRIGPFEVESALLEHAAVAESAVVASPHAIRGTIVKAYVVLAPGYSGSEELTKELQDHVKNVTAPYKYPREIEFVNGLPKTVSGKIRRIELRERAFATQQAAARPAGAE